MKVLYINYILQQGHVNYDRIHIQALIKQGYDVQIIAHTDIANELPFPHERYALILPAFLGKDSTSPLINRLIYILTLVYILLHTTFRHYDRVVLSSMEEISLGLFPLCHDMYITCHGNANTINNPIKRFFIRRLARHNTFLVFNDRMKEPFYNIGVQRVKTISHGCVDPFPQTTSELTASEADNHRFVVFHPSSKLSPHFAKLLASDSSLDDFLKSEDILLVLRGNSDTLVLSPNIKVINHRLSTAVYRSIFVNADAILIAYPEDFKYQVSGISFECVANRKNMLIYANPALDYCKSFCNYDPTFDNVAEFKARLLYLKQHPEACCIASADMIAPDYHKVFETRYTSQN